MSLPPVRVKQSTSTTGTGTLTLNAAASDFRSFAAAFGASSAKVRYVLSRSGVYEVGYGTFNGTTSLTRDTVVASSNGGALVSLAAGTTDVFVDFLPGDWQFRTISANTTLALADIGNVIRCTQSADITVTLPAVATVPGDANGLCNGFIIRNAGTNNSIVWIDPNGAETLDGSVVTFPLFAGETMTVLSIGTAWVSVNRPSGWRQVARTSAGVSASVDFILPAYPSIARAMYRVDFRQVRPGTDGGALTVRTSATGGASYDAGASDYQRSQGVVVGAALWQAAAPADSAIIVSTDIDSTAGGSQVTGYLILNPGAAVSRNPTLYGQSLTQGNGASYAGAQLVVFAGYRAAAQDVNALRFIMSTGNINLGDFTLSALFD